MKTLRIKTLAFMSFFLSTFCFASEMTVNVDGNNYVIDTSRSVADVYEQSTEEDVTETALLAKILKAAIDAKQNELRSEVARLSAERDDRPTEGDLDALRTQLANMTRERDDRPTEESLDALRTELAIMTRERDARPTEENLDALRTELASMTRERDDRPSEGDLDALRTQLANITRERDDRPTREQLAKTQEDLRLMTGERNAKQGGWSSPSVFGIAAAAVTVGAIAAKFLMVRR